MRMECSHLRSRPANDTLIRLSRKLNHILNKREYMLCSYIYLMLKRGRLSGLRLVLYIFFWYVIDGFFRLVFGQKSHCKECLQYELITSELISKEDKEDL